MNIEQMIDHGVSMGQQGRLDEAESMLRQAVTTDPASPRAHLNLGVVLVGLNRSDEAVSLIRRSIELRNDVPSAHHTLAKLLLKLARPVEAIEACKAALHLAPDDADTHVTLSRALLMSGDFRRGWAEFEWRWKLPALAASARRFEQPRWNGVKAPGKTILLHHEQSAADAIQFLRYVPLMAEREATVIVQVPGELLDLVKRMPDVAEVVPVGAPLPPFDLHIPMMSLPLAFNTTTKTVPAKVPYLSPGSKLIESWKQRMQSEPARLRVGLAGSLPLSEYAPLAALGDVSFHLLEKATAADSAATAPAGMNVIDVTTKLLRVSDFAAAVANLDVIVSTDGWIAHLAGAMARPVWTLLPFSPDVRWMLGRLDTPWYPTMRLFRQPTADDWGTPIHEVAAALAQLAASGNAV